MKLLSAIVLVLSLACGRAWGLADDAFLDPFWDFYAGNQFPPEAAGRGYTGIAGEGAIDLSILNPAAIANICGLQVVGGYGMRSELPWFRELWQDVGRLYAKPLHPSLYGGIGYSLNEQWQIGVVYHDAYSLYFDEGTNFWTGPNGESLGISDIYTKARIGKLTFPVAFSLTPEVTLGFSLDVGRYYRYSYRMFGDVDYSSSTTWYNVMPRIGAVIRQNHTLSFGMSASPPLKSRYEETSRTLSGAQTISSYSYHAPLRVGIGARYTLDRTLCDFFLDFQYVGLAAVDDYLEDRYDLHIGMDYTRRNWQFRAGFFTCGDYRRSEPAWLYLFPVGNDDQYYLTCGLSRYFGSLGITASLLDSHLLSPGEWKTTVVNGGISYIF